MKHIKKTYTKFNGGYVLESIHTVKILAADVIYHLLRNKFTTFKGGHISTIKSGDKMTKNIFLIKLD